MKEIEYKDIPGNEDQNTQVQLDSFEPRKVFGSKDRYIYDFSMPGISSSAIFGSGNYGDVAYYAYEGNPYFEANSRPNYKYRLGFRNFAINDRNRELTLGMPGNAEVVWKNKPFFVDADQSFVLPNITYTDGIGYIPQAFETDTTTVDRRMVPYFDKNAAIFLDASFLGAYGQYGTQNYIKSFRSGYIEFTIKTETQNCIFGYGSAKATGVGDYNVQAKDAVNGSTVDSGEPIFIDKDNGTLNEEYSSFNEMKIEIVNGKLQLSYEDLFGSEQNSFKLVSNKTIADGEWHHVVINFGKPGVLRSNRKKANKRFIEIWVDGKSDLVNFDVIENKQIFFPLIEWLFVNPNLTFASHKNSYYESWDSAYPQGIFGATNIGAGSLEFDPITTAEFNPIGDSIMFTGAVNHYVSGILFALTSEEIQLRYALVKEFSRVRSDTIEINATMVNPKVSTNKKKALKLFWNNIENNTNGIELDDNYTVNTLSVTHNNLISSTETYNLDYSNNKNIKYLPDVKIVLTENVNVFGPGRIPKWSMAKLQNGIEALLNLNSFQQMNSLSFPLHNYPNGYKYTESFDDKITSTAIKDIPFSGLNLIDGDRILLTNQLRAKENGIWVFNGHENVLTRPVDVSTPADFENAIVYVTSGYFKNTAWALKNNIVSVGDPQRWIQLEGIPNSETANVFPIFTTRYRDELGKERFIDLEQDIDIEEYDLIVFMNYPTTNEELFSNFIGYDSYEIKQRYDNFIKSIQNVCAQGASLYVSSPKLAQDLGIIKNYEVIDQMLESSDAQSATISPFEANEPADQYFDTHRINQYQLQTEVPGLTNKETYILTDFINYVPSNINENEEYHAKYAYRQFGLKEGNQFFIPSLSLLKITENDKLPGFNANRRMSKPLAVVEPNQINVGTIVTKLQNTYYQNGQIVNNPHDDDATTIIVHNGQILNGQPITGKIFVNFVEDGYTMSREEYNKAIIQVLPTVDTNETTTTRAWQYSTTRLNRVPRKINIRALTEYGQTTPTNGGGGPLIQASSNASNGIIRSKTDSGNINYQSDLYTSEAEEIYPIQEIPVLSMTWLGLQWLAE